MATSFANLFYQGSQAGVAYWDEERRAASFQYTPEFVRSGVELAPLMMPLRNAPYQFTNLHESFGGLPGLLADSLPDVYGNTLIDDWLRQQGRVPADFSPVERLCYVGNRGMGALGFRPGLRPERSAAEQLDVDRLVELACKVLADRKGLAVDLDEDGLNEILRVGTSAGVTVQTLLKFAIFFSTLSLLLSFFLPTSLLRWLNWLLIVTVMLSLQVISITQPMLLSWDLPKDWSCLIKKPTKRALLFWRNSAWTLVST